MSRLRILILGLAWLVAGGLPVFGSPLVSVPSGDIAFTVAVTIHPGPDYAQFVKNTPKKADIVRTGNLYRNLVTWQDNTVREVWGYTDLHLSFAVDPRFQGVRMARGEDGLPSVFRLDPKGYWISWIGNDSFVGTEMVGAQKCNRYQKSMPISKDFTLSDGKVIEGKNAIFQVWIDAETLVPVAFDDGAAYYKILFGQPPAVALRPPAAVEKELSRVQAALGLVPSK